MPLSSTRKQSHARSTRRRTAPPKRRWLVFALALVIAAGAFWVLLQSGSQRRAAQGTPPMDDIGDASRVRLEQVLRDAETAAEPGK
jgi:hypothetical protein